MAASSSANAFGIRGKSDSEGLSVPTGAEYTQDTADGALSLTACRNLLEENSTLADGSKEGQLFVFACDATQRTITADFADGNNTLTVPISVSGTLIWTSGGWRVFQGPASLALSTV